MNRRDVLLVFGAVAAAGSLSVGIKPAEALPKRFAANLPGKPVLRWLETAEKLQPELVETAQTPISLVRPVAVDGLVLRYRMETEAPASALNERVFHKGDSVIIDFGGHRTGYLSFRLDTQGRSPDSPTRLRLVFGEIPTDVAEPLYPYKGQLSEAWLPDEVVNIDDLPQAIRLSRRYAFRYVKIEVIDTSSGYGVLFREVKAHAVTAARNSIPPLPASYPALLRRIDEVSTATLRDCLQTTFEDGPRRDRRLWIGDLRLQALTNYATFRANDVVKRCLYLFAAFPREDGLVNACVYERPKPAYGGIVIIDYAALFNVTLHDYVEATGDVETGRDLWPVAKRQLEIISKYISDEGLFVEPEDEWIFIDWATALDRHASILGVFIYACEHTLALAQRIGKESEVASYQGRVARMRQAARHAFYDGNRELFVSGPNSQVSWASQVWMVLAGVLATKEEGSRAIRAALADRSAIKPVTPYLYHYVVDAMLECGMFREARALVENYWGGMVKAGADTFWEIYDPASPLSSPYGDIHINSYCHAWSCTPAYLLRSRGLGRPNR